MDKLDLIVDIIKETREIQKELVEFSRNHKEETLIWQNNADHRLKNIEIDLHEHKEGVIQNREAMKIFNKRLDIAEAPSKAFKKVAKTVVKYAAGITTICGMIYGITRLL